MLVEKHRERTLLDIGAGGHIPRVRACPLALSISLTTVEMPPVLWALDRPSSRHEDDCVQFCRNGATVHCVRTRFDSGHQRMLRAALDAAADEVTQHGWRGLQMQAVAQRIGVSRQTLYNAFENKHGLAKALVLRLTEEFLAGVERALASSVDVREQWRAAIHYTLDTAAADPLLEAVLTADGRDELLPLLTSDAEPVISAARNRLAGAVRVIRPDIPLEDAVDAAETATRLAISHIVLPLHPTDHVARHVADLIEGYLGRSRPDEDHGLERASANRSRG